VALECARALGGSLRLFLTPTHVVAQLALPRTAFATALPAAKRAVLSRFSYAIVDDSFVLRKMLGTVLSQAFSEARAPPLVAGMTRDSVEDFPRAVVANDVDVVFIDQNFGNVCADLVGTDLVEAIRALDDAATQPQAKRLVFIVSANDSADDFKRYKISGADDGLAKGAVTRSGIEQLLRKHAAAALARAASRP
jgi:CheY-like chemotaxis protein